MICPTHKSNPSRDCPVCMEDVLLPHDPECQLCHGSGIIDNYIGHLTEYSLSEFCDCSVDLDANPDVDGDGWLDFAGRQEAKFKGPRLDADKVTKIVLHCGNSASANFGPYFANPVSRDRKTGKLKWRKVSAHAAVLDNGDVFQFVPYNRQAYHCRGHNATSLGIETQGPHTRRDHTEKMLSALLYLLAQYLQVYPSITDLYAHRSLDPKRRRDPGLHFPWEPISQSFPRLRVMK